MEAIFYRGSPEGGRIPLLGGGVTLLARIPAGT